MTSTVIEIVEFKLNENASDVDLTKTHEGLERFLLAQSGFLYRSLSKQEDGRYIDIVYWASLDDAEKASDAIMQDPNGQAMIALCDMESVTMKHLPIVTETMSQQCEEEAA